MIITGFGISCFRIESKGLSILIDPPRSGSMTALPTKFAEQTSGKGSPRATRPTRPQKRGLRGEGVRKVRARPDLLLITHDHPDHANFELRGEDTFVVSTPGEYELNGIPIAGLATFHDKDGGRTLGRNTAFIFELEELRLAHLGDLADRKHLARTGDEPASLEEAVTPCDILFVPCGGKTVLGPAEAAELVRIIKPKIAIPMHAASFTPLATALGAKLEKLERLSLRPSDLPKEGTRLVALSPGI